MSTCIILCMPTLCGLTYLEKLTLMGFFFQNKRASDPPANKRLRVDELKKGDSWRTGVSEELQVGQVFFYLRNCGTAEKYSKAPTSSPTAQALC